MTRRIAVLLLFAVPFVCEAQSLGSVAKKEKERRDKNKQQGVAVREVRDDEVDTLEDEKPEEPAPESAVDASEVDPSDDDRIDVKVGTGDAKAPEDADSARRRDEAQWRARFQESRARVSAARERVQILEGLHLGQGERYVDEQGKTVIEGVDDLQRLNSEAKAELEEAEKSLKDLQEEARRAGIPPGWLR